ncbi:MAG: hypothetical protein KF760_32530 [Candidatus Eremiobacteraeota bacterium]|nr:hypothetical protein [Candidatus Eremiobacteraeota bacterium]MCW5870340.1 hypothetical protein [Candidatus Eremiobacteraeota bacterium]
MGSTGGYSVETVPNRKPLPWRLPALLLLLLAAAGIYWWSRPYCQVAGHYRGRIGTEFSYEKFQLVLTLNQNGAQVKGSCEVSHQTRGKLITQRAKLGGLAQGGSFRISGPFEDGRLLFLEGYPKKTGDGTILMGETWTQAGKTTSDRVSYRVERLDGRISPKDLSVKKSR